MENYFEKNVANRFPSIYVFYRPGENDVIKFKNRYNRSVASYSSKICAK